MQRCQQGELRNIQILHLHIDACERTLPHRQHVRPYPFAQAFRPCDWWRANEGEREAQSWEGQGLEAL